MKTNEALFARFESIRQPEINEEMLSAYIEGNLNDFEAQAVSEAVSQSDLIADIVADGISEDYLFEEMAPWIEEIQYNEIPQAVDTPVYADDIILHDEPLQIFDPVFCDSIDPLDDNYIFDGESLAIDEASYADYSTEIDENAYYLGDDDMSDDIDSEIDIFDAL